MGCDMKLLAIIVIIIIIGGSQGAYEYFMISENWTSTPDYQMLHWKFYMKGKLPDDADRAQWLAQYGTKALEYLRWRFIGFQNASALMGIVFYTYCLKTYVFNGKFCLSFLLALVAGGAYIAVCTMYYLSIQEALDMKDQTFGVDLLAYLGLGADIYACILFFFMIFGCMCGCCRSETRKNETVQNGGYGGRNFDI